MPCKWRLYGKSSVQIWEISIAVLDQRMVYESSLVFFHFFPSIFGWRSAIAKDWGVGEPQWMSMQDFCGAAWISSIGNRLVKSWLILAATIEKGWTWGTSALGALETHWSSQLVAFPGDNRGKLRADFEGVWLSSGGTACRVPRTPGRSRSFTASAVRSAVVWKGMDGRDLHVFLKPGFTTVTVISIFVCIYLLMIGFSILPQAFHMTQGNGNVFKGKSPIIIAESWWTVLPSSLANASNAKRSTVHSHPA